MDTYDNPLVSRYAGPEMSALWGPRRKFGTWRRLWLWLAEAEAELALLGDDGEPRISQSQLDEMRAHLDDIDLAAAERYEREFRHDVMAHNHAFGDAAPSARGIIHLGATSCDITDNADLMLLKEALGLVRDKLVGLIDGLATFAAKWKEQATVGFTHFQPAQLTTVGKRATLWCQELLLDLAEIEHRLASLRFRGVKGATGTQASFLSLFGDADKVARLERLVSEKAGFASSYAVTGQTYSRKVDAQILDALSGIGQSLHKMGTDVRLLAHRQEIDEPTEAGQVGSSAMPYKRNPMRSERMCGLARYLMALPASAAHTSATQWLERTLDDSVNRRLTLPQAFLATDAALRLGINVIQGLEVFPAIIAANVAAVLPYMATENLMMAGVAAGGDRQQLHETIRGHSRAISAEARRGESGKPLLDRLKEDERFKGVDFAAVLEAGGFVGLAPRQVEAFLATEVGPVRTRYAHLLGQRADIVR